MKKKTYVTYERLLRTERTIEELKNLGVVFIKKKSKIKIILGCVCLAIAIFPNGLGFIFFPLAGLLFSSAGINMFLLRSEIKRRIKNKIHRVVRRL